MFGRILNRIKYFSSNAQQKTKNLNTLKLMAQKIESMKQTMQKSSPKAMTILFILSTIPTFYFIKQMFEHEYNSDQYLLSTQNTMKYFYLKNMIFFCTSLILTKMNFKNPSSKYILQRIPFKYQYVPLILSFIGIMLPPTDTKHVIWPALLTDIFTMAFELQATNQGILPVWFYSYRHFIRFFDILIFIMVYRSLKKYQDRKKSHPHQFVKEITQLAKI